MKTEAELTKSALKVIKKSGRGMKIVGGAAQEAGISDILACVSGRFLAIETKRPGFPHKLTALQCRYLDDIEKANGYAAVCTCDEEVMIAVRQAVRGSFSKWRNATDERAFPKRNRDFGRITSN